MARASRLLLTAFLPAILACEPGRISGTFPVALENDDNEPVSIRWDAFLEQTLQPSGRATRDVEFDFEDDRSSIAISFNAFGGPGLGVSGQASCRFEPPAEQTPIRTVRWTGSDLTCVNWDEIE